MRSSIVLLVAGMGWACGGGGPTASEVSVAPVADAVLAAAPVPVSSIAPGTKLGVVFTANVLGELEPCG